MLGSASRPSRRVDSVALRTLAKTRLLYWQAGLWALWCAACKQPGGAPAEEPNEAATRPVTQVGMHSSGTQDTQPGRATLRIEALFAESVTLIPAQGSPLELALMGVTAQVDLPRVRWSWSARDDAPHLPQLRWYSPDPSETVGSQAATVEVLRPISFRGAVECLTLRTTKLVEQPDFVLAPGSHFHRVSYDDETGLCVGCYASLDDWLPGDPLRCGDALTEVCGLQIPCDALEGPAHAVDDGGSSYLPEWEEEHRVGVIIPEIYPECADPDLDCQPGPVQVILRQSGGPLTVLSSKNLNVISARHAAATSVNLVDFGFRAEVTIDPKLVVYPPDQGPYSQQGGCKGSHGRGLCGGSEVQPGERVTARLETGTPLYDLEGREWSRVSAPFDVVYTRSSNPEELVRIETRALQGICESEDACLCNSLLLVRQADLTSETPNAATR